MNCFINTYYAYTKFIPTDIYPVQYGEEQCNRNHSFGPCVRSNYLLHYVYSGKGIFQTENNTYHLHKGQMFLISPNQLTYYKADDSDPWLYRWIEFNGSMSQSILKSVSLNESTPIYTDDENNSIGNALCNIISSGEMCFELLMQKFWNFIYCLTDGEQINTVSNAEEYIQKAETFIKTNVHKKISVSDVAKYIGIDRSYLTRLFNEYKKTSPQNYIISLKMNTAALYLKSANASVTETAQSVGYCDTHIFNRTFKKQFGVPPTTWRQKQIWEQSIIVEQKIGMERSPFRRGTPDQSRTGD